MEEIPEARFPLGRVVITPGVVNALGKNHQKLWRFLVRHQQGEWGDLDEYDKNENEVSVHQDRRLRSIHHLDDGTQIWLITEFDRSTTIILLPSEYVWSARSPMDV